MIKILHTSDLHIGKRLYQADLYEEQSLFFQWLVNTIREQNINALLISGDVFDVANPSSESRRVYFELLRELMKANCKVIIAGGNHDSPAMLEAPKTLLSYLDIHVTGGLPSDLKELLVPITSAQGNTELVVACIPYLRDADLRQYNQDETHKDQIEAIRMGITRIFHNAAYACKDLHPEIPAIAMGHLFVQGGEFSESERDIQIGNIAGLEANHLPGYFSYYALGHLHKPQEPTEKMVYSGSPVKLSFSEAENENRVMIITAENGNVSKESIAVPRFRRLLAMKGTVDELREKLIIHAADSTPLKDFIELIAVEEHHDPTKTLQLETLINEFEHDYATILKYRITFANSPASMASLYDENKNIAEMKPVDVFTRRMEKEGLEDETREMLLEAFIQLLEEVESKTEE